MDILKVLNERIKPELNMLYTVPPFKITGYYDGGWFCRYHAFHCAVLCKMLGKESAIVTGHFALSAGDVSLTSLDTDSGHAWCSVESTKPVDISMTLMFMPPQVPRWKGGIIGTEPHDGFEIVYTCDEPTFREKVEANKDKQWVGFLEESKVEDSFEELVRNPFLFLNPTGDTGWDKVYGSDIFNKVTFHLYQIASGRTAPLFPQYADAGPTVQDFVVKLIKTRYPGAQRKVLAML